MEDNERKILEGLNEEQKKAVQCVDGPVLIVAGAGSGKTRVLTSRVAYLLAKGVDPQQILALTFTKKAAGEMKERIGMMVGARNARHVVMGTFHSVFVRFLREYADFLGYPEQFTIYDQSDQTSAIKACVKELGLDEKVYKPREVLSRIGMAKNNLVLVDKYLASASIQAADRAARKPEIGHIYQLYQAKMKQAGVMDFDDILVNMNILLRDKPEAAPAIASRFSFIMVDEYQDTNVSQYIILKRLASYLSPAPWQSEPRSNICVVGDDSQSIYAFRGAKIENILNFKKDYPNCFTCRLERNYRSTQNIVNAANSLIARNEGRIPKECYSVGESGEKLQLIHAYTEQEEAVLIVSDILSRMRQDSAKYQDFAILYRTNSQSRALEDALRRRNIPYIIYSGNAFFERAEVKDLMAYFKLAVNPYDDESFKRVVNKPARAIGDTSVSALNEVARAHGCPLFRAAYQEDYAQYGLRDAAMQKIRAFCKMIEGLAIEARTADAFAMAQKIADVSGLYAFYKSDTSIEGLARTANVEELVNSVQAFVEEREDEMEADAADAGIDFVPGSTTVTLTEYLEDVSLLSNVDVKEDEDSANRVSLMTVHSAKGLEYPYVFVAGLEENLFPTGGLLASNADIEEERRLCYVAITRAKRVVTLTYSSSRMRNGQHQNNPPSRFIREIDPKYFDKPLDDDDDDAEMDDGVARSPFGPRSFSGFGSGKPRFGGTGQDSRSSFGGGNKYNYGKSSGVTYHKPGFGQRTAPQPQKPIVTAPAPTPNVAKPDVIDPNFVPVPMTELYVGERVEHNRFGGGLIKEITGTVPELKAKIVFDRFGEKLLLLKYAKLRPEK